MRYLLSGLIFLLSVSGVHADEQGKPNTLTRQEIADGWILLFDGKTTFGWKTEGEASVQDGTLVLGGKKASQAISTTRFGNCELKLEFLGQTQLVLGEGGSSSSWGLGNPTSWQAAHARIEFDPERSKAGITINAVTSENPSVFEAKARFSGNPVTLRFEVPAGGKGSLRNIKLRPLDLKSIFNGKDLSGWKEFKGQRYKSNFTVTPEGWIHIQNGPGDLQTEGEWDNFVLQADCRTNGDRLNSGIFFRCRPNEYQNGYEAQIHNGFLAPPGKEYTLDEYDSATHKLMDKKKIRYTAMDYGTGAIYRRIPARFQAAKDREWFTMTIIAQGNHMATWVNGIQMVDWTDNRLPNDNARNGCKLGKGPISLQGHDRTTDLYFRNIRIAELPTSKESNSSQPNGGK
jgi:hypothetical protein